MATTKKKIAVKKPRAPRKKALVATQEEIARKAYELWEARGGVGGSAEQDWLEAERHFKK